MVSRDEVLGCYRFILGRDPESEEVVREHLAASSLAELRSSFIGSAEFQRISGSIGAAAPDIDACLPPQVWQANPVDCEATPEQLVVLLDRIRREWEGFGKTEPHWSVLTHDNYRQDAIAGNIEEFYASGMFVANIIKAFFERHGLEPAKLRNCFELGCGVGRITIHLARLFDSVVGADISKFHLDVCREELGRRRVRNVELLCLDSPARLEALSEIRFFCSFIVLQHNPPPVITYILDTVLARLGAGGAAVFQVPTWRRGYADDLDAYLRRPKRLHMEMHVLPQAHVHRIIARNGCRLLELREDGWAEGRTAATISNTFFVVRD